MTTLAQIHDCHSCNDERSIVQKKSLFVHDTAEPQSAFLFEIQKACKSQGVYLDMIQLPTTMRI